MNVQQPTFRIDRLARNIHAYSDEVFAGRPVEKPELEQLTRDLALLERLFSPTEAIAAPKRLHRHSAAAYQWQKSQRMHGHSRAALSHSIMELQSTVEILKTMNDGLWISAGIAEAHGQQADAKQDAMDLSELLSNVHQKKKLPTEIKEVSTDFPVPKLSQSTQYVSIAVTVTAAVSMIARKWRERKS